MIEAALAALILPLMAHVFGHSLLWAQLGAPKLHLLPLLLSKGWRWYDLRLMAVNYLEKYKILYKNKICTVINTIFKNHLLELFRTTQPKQSFL